jgi:hypothetical protein
MEETSCVVADSDKSRIKNFQIVNRFVIFMRERKKIQNNYFTPVCGLKGRSGCFPAEFDPTHALWGCK